MRFLYLDIMEVIREYSFLHLRQDGNKNKITNVYPNPVENTFRINFGSTIDKNKTTIELFTILKLSKLDNQLIIVHNSSIRIKIYKYMDARDFVY